jgi:hypothetical protein
MAGIMGNLYGFNDLMIVCFVWIFYIISGFIFFYPLKLLFDRIGMHGNSFFSVTIIGTTLSLNAVLLIFVLIQSISTVKNIKEITNNELRSLYAIQKAIVPLSSQGTDQIKPQFQEYLNSVISREWQYMSTNEIDEKTEQFFDDFLDSLLKFTPQNLLEKKIKEELLPLTKEAASARYLRIKNRGTQLPAVFFIAVLLLEFLFVLHFALLTKRDAFSQCALTIYQSSLGILLGLIVIYDYPFQGESGIAPTEFMHLLEQIDNFYGGEYR